MRPTRRRLVTQALRAASSLHRRSRRGPVTLTPKQAERYAKLLADFARYTERTKA